MSKQRHLNSGELIDVFRIERVLGAGGFGITYLAFDTSFDRHVAIKEYFPQNAWREGQGSAINTYGGETAESFQLGLERFHIEGKILARFSHPNIVRVQRIIPANETYYLVMDYENGETLEAYLIRLDRPLTYEETEIIFNPALDGLRIIHEHNLLHLDIKPENIFLRSDGTPVLIDFGGARHQLGKTSHVVSFLVATDGYAPNEQYTGKHLTPSSDIYAMAATIYRSITQNIPSDAKRRGAALIDETPDPLVSVRQAVAGREFPESFIQTLEDALSLKINTRPQSVREFQQRLFTSAEPQRRIPFTQPVSQEVTNTNSQLQRPQRSFLLPVSIGFLVLLIMGILWYFVFNKEKKVKVIVTPINPVTNPISPSKSAPEDIAPPPVSPPPRVSPEKVLMNSLIVLASDIRGSSQKMKYLRSVKEKYKELIEAAGSEARKKQYKENLLNADRKINDAEEERRKKLETYIDHIKNLCSYDSSGIDQIVSKMKSDDPMRLDDYQLINSHRKHYCLGGAVSEKKFRENITKDLK